MGREALEDILYRAQLELYAQPLLVRPFEYQRTHSFRLKLSYFSIILATARKRHEELATRQPSR